MRKTQIRIDYDGTWKIVTTNLIEDFIKFFLPKLYKDVDFSVPPEFLEQELYEMVEDEKIKNILDKLVKLKLKNGQEKWIFVHIEFQTKGKINERMFLYYRRILDKYGKEITAIVIYTGKSIPKNHDRYEYESYGTKVSYQFNTYLVAKQKEEVLVADSNPFAIVVLANLFTLQTSEDLSKRLSFKEKVYEIAQSRQYSIDKTTELFIFVKDLMQLSPDLEAEYNNFIIKQQKSEDMRTISQGMKDFMHQASIEFFGQSIVDTSAKLQEALKDKQDALKDKQDALKDKQDALKMLVHSILNLKEKMNLNTEQIASILEIDEEFVGNVLSKSQD